MILALQNPQAKVADVFLMLDETTPNIDRKTDTREFQATIEDIAHWAGISIAEARDILHTFVVQNRLEMYSTRMVVKNINDFTRIVNYRRKQAKHPKEIKT